MKQLILKGESNEIENSNGSIYAMTFCDRGNNLYDLSEYYAEQNNPPDGIWGENDNQNIEPFEDRNCNDTRDIDELLTVSSNCPTYFTSHNGLDFCDRGNGIWDNDEECYVSCSNRSFPDDV